MEVNLFFKYLNFSVIIFSIFVFIDIAVKVKIGIVNKSIMLILVSSFMIAAILIFFQSNYKETFFALSICRLCYIYGYYLFFRNLLIKKFPKWFNVIFILSLILSIYLSFDYITNEKNILSNNLSFTVIISKQSRLFLSLFNINRVFICSIAIYIFITFKKLDNRNIYFKSLKRWSIFFLVIPIFFTLYSFFSIIEVINFKVEYLIILFLLYNILILHFRPSFLNRQNFHVDLFSTFKMDENLVLSDENFIKPFFMEHYYLNKEANIQDFCRLNNIVEYDIFNSLVIKKYNMSFNNLINMYRIEYFKEIAKSPKFKNYSTEALALESGFKSRSQMYKYFKNFHGGTPADFIKTIAD